MAKWKEWFHVFHSSMRALMANEKKEGGRRMQTQEKCARLFTPTTGKKQKNRKLTVHLVVYKA